MAKPIYQRFEQPEGLESEALKLLEKCNNKDPTWIRRGTNETTKAIEKKTAKLVYIALDVDPPEVVSHLPLLCEEKKVPYVYVDNKQDLGKATGLEISMASSALIAFGEYEKETNQISDRVKELANIK